MTDRTPSLPTQSVTPSQTALLSPKSTPSLPSHVSNKVQALVEEEPYTIKCICDFADDDGNTIYCEICDTWQHIECYYPLNMDEALREDFAHSCADCKPRPLDHQGARERQRLRRSRPNTTETSERKAKRPPSKTNKKKTKPTDLALNGHAGFDTNTKHLHDHPPTHQHKKSKSTHRPSQSISSQNPKRSPSYSQKSGNPHGHPPSPATTPPDISHELEVHYSSAFLNLYKDDRDVSIVQTNSFASLSISNVLSLWLRDHDKLRAETGCRFEHVFRSLPPNIDLIKASPRVETKKLVVGSDTVVHWQHLTTSETIDKEVPLIELNGQIGIQKDYCNDPENRWQELSSPLPFVFFHPMLPIYIDTRKEGSVARYVRRSCKPNAVLDTYLSGSSEYHFWLVSDRRIAPSEQITIPWEFNLQKDVARRWEQLLGLGDEETGTQPDYNDKEMETYQSIASWVHAILSEYGGCACDLGPDCAFARFHRTYIIKPQQQSKEKSTKKKSRKTKTNTISPTSTGHATNSRAPSEGHGDDGADNDSGSSRSKPPSRDMTPAPRQGSFDTLGVLTELTDRDKRKVQMVEDSFRRMEQQQPPRKKKRVSDGTGNPGSTTKFKPKSSTSLSTGMPNGASERRYVDAGTSRSMSGSPASTVSPNTASHFKQHDSRQSSNRIPSRHTSQGPHPEYRDASVQTDPVDGEWFSSVGQTPKAKRRVVSLSKRLLETRHRLRVDEDRRRKSTATSPTSVASAIIKMDLNSPTVEQCPMTATPETIKDQRPTLPAVDSSVDIPMIDAPPVSPTDTKGLPINDSSTITATTTAPMTPMTIKNKSPELRVQMPPAPAFNTSTISSVTTPLSTTGTAAQSPFSASNLPSPFAPPSVNGVAVQPSPIKKKLSLSDYTKSRMNKAAAAKPGALKPPTTVVEEAKSPSSTDTVMLDPPGADKNAD
ncbi:SET domain-containing protein 3 [Parahypoxylon ruwenzoriense]